VQQRMPPSRWHSQVARGSRGYSSLPNTESLGRNLRECGVAWSDRRRSVPRREGRGAVRGTTHAIGKQPPVCPLEGRGNRVTGNDTREGCMLWASLFGAWKIPMLRVPSISCCEERLSMPL
jgi:hypothetical protein